MSDTRSPILGTFNIKAVHIPAKKSSHTLRSVNTDLGLKVLGPVVHVNVEKCVQDRQVNPLKHGAKDVNNICLCINQTYLQWQNTA